MKVKELIKKLSQMPQDAKVAHIWDGAIRTNIELVWLSRGGIVATCDFGMVVYADENRPMSAPTEKEVRYWYSPKSLDKIEI